MRRTNALRWVGALCLSEACAIAFGFDAIDAPFGPPHERSTCERLDIEGVAYWVCRNEFGSAPTITWLKPDGDEQLDVVDGPVSPEALIAWFTEFVDAHPELFGVPSSQMSIRTRRLSGPWGIVVAQYYEGVRVFGAYVDVIVSWDGRLQWLTARLFPAADLTTLPPVPPLSREAAEAEVLDVHGGGEVWPSFESTPWVAFPAGKPRFAWEVWVTFDEVGVRYARWHYFLDAHAREVFAIHDWFGDPATWVRLFTRADANLDGLVNVSDPVMVLDRLFATGEQLPCDDAADANDDGAVNVSDAIYTLQFLFAGGAAPPAPYPDPGVDKTWELDDLRCYLCL